MTVDVTMDRLTNAYLKIKRHRENLKREFEEKDEPLAEDLEKIKDEMRKLCKEQNAKSVKTDAGTVILTVKEKYFTSDWDAMYDFIMENNMPQLLTRSIHQGNLKEFLEENPDKFPPGVNIDAVETITVRKPPNKK